MPNEKAFPPNTGLYIYEQYIILRSIKAIE